MRTRSIVLLPLVLGLLAFVLPARTATRPPDAMASPARPPRADNGPAAPRSEQTDPYGRPVLQAGTRLTYRADDTKGTSTLGARPDGVGGPSAAALAAGAPTIALEWRRGVLGTGIGANGLHVVDLDGDGHHEVVATASSQGSFWGNDFWYVLKRNGTGYEQSWVSPVYADGVSALRVADVDGDGDLDVVVGSGRKILVYDGATLSPLATIQTGASAVHGLRVVDVDGDGALEFVFADDYDLWIYGVEDGVLEARLSGYGGADLDVGNVDDDADLEIVVTQGGFYGGTGRVIDGRTHAVKWTNPNGFGVYVRIGDVDGDGRGEIVAGNAWYKITVYDADVRSAKYDIPTDLDIDAVQLFDVDRDGRLEIVYGDGQWGEVHVLNGATGIEKWSASNPEHGVTDVAVGDADDDGTPELLWGAGYSSTGPDYLFVVSTTTRQQEWKSEDIAGPFYAMTHGDIDGDGSPELAYASFESDSGYGDGLVFVHDARTKALEWRSPQPTGITWTGLWRVQAAQLDADPALEMLVTAGYAYDGVLLCWDGATHAQQWSARIPSGLTFRSLAVADLDGDGVLEIVAGTAREHTGAPGLYVYVFDSRTGAVKWTSPDFGVYWGSLTLLRVAQLDADPALEIAVGNASGALKVYDGVTHEEQLVTPSLGLTSLETADTDGDGIAELIVGTIDGTVQVLDPADGHVVRTIGSYGDAVNGLRVKDLDGDGIGDLVFGLGGELFVYSGAAPSTALWRSGEIGSNVGAQDSLMIADVDGDDHVEIVANLGASGLAVYEVGGKVNHPPIASAGPDRTWECTGGLHATALLDGSASSDADSAPGTNDDLAAWYWTEGSATIAEGIQASADLGLGAHTIRLRVVDKPGASGFDTVKHTVIDSLAPAGGVVSPAPAACIGLSQLPVTVVDDFADRCGQAITRSWSPGPGPSYSTHGDHVVTVTATDASGNAAASSIAFSIDRLAPEVEIISPPRQAVIPDAFPFRLVFTASDADGAAGDVVLEQVQLRDKENGRSCLAFDGRTYGDRDGLLSDEEILLGQGEICAIAATCGFTALDHAEFRVEAVDCAGNVGFATRTISGQQALYPGACAP